MITSITNKPDEMDKANSMSNIQGCSGSTIHSNTLKINVTKPTSAQTGLARVLAGAALI